MIIILVMFYIIYQYFSLAEINQAEIARREYQLDQAQTELEAQKTKLSDAEKQMIANQVLLDAKENELKSAQEILEQQQSELKDTQSALAEAQAALDSQQAQLTQQQAQLTQQQTQLENQQAQLEQLVGLKTRLISSLSSALKTSNISATVDPANGSIALESDVLFESGQYDLTERGKRFVDEFLPVYLNVLFSDEYRGYVSEIIIEGHTDSDGKYLDNLELSQQRALAVASYVLGDSCPRSLRRFEKRAASGGHGKWPQLFRPHLRRQRRRGQGCVPPRGVQIPPDGRADDTAAARHSGKRG